MHALPMQKAALLCRNEGKRRMNREYKVGVVSLGCSKNTVDTENMLGYFVSQGFEITSRAEEADVLVVNTCGFIDSAKSESIETVLEMAEYKKQGKCSILAVTGCLPQRYMQELKAEMPEVDIFWGVKKYDEFTDAVIAKLNESAPFTDCNVPRVLTTPFYSAYLRISDGCSNRCTYCAIPLIRGDMCSVPMEKLLQEAERLAKAGVTELNVIAQDTSAYGKDLYDTLKLPELLNKLTEVEGIHWVRLLYTYPDTVTDELIETIEKNPKIVNYMDLPIQHVNDELLLRMNRRGQKKDIIRIFDRLRKSESKFIIRTSIIVGFPGETEDSFRELLDFVSDYGIDRLGAFTYSCEEGTEAAGFDEQIDEEVKERRLHELMMLQANVSSKLNAKRVGTECELLVEEIEDGYITGRTYAEAPDVDGQVTVPLRGRYDIDVGDYIKIKITGADEYDLEGEII